MEGIWDILKTLIVISLPVIFSSVFNKDKRNGNRRYSSETTSVRKIKQDYELISEEDGDEPEQVEFVYVESSETNQEKEIFPVEVLEEERINKEKLEDREDDIIKQNEVNDKPVFTINFNSDDILRGIIMSEILSKPKSLR
ncbi:hypothetical protein SAMN02745135_00497 [Caloranaerobacter azorensis DSM 13643]|uniref:Uncharacterized protein n=1 Tax=Caloranaerobacter azorensis DSM 13643 TaxID=1121264 RepID=A0A1M5S7Y8_9FIRM|nr:hypothetical protein [Caloranaerobacter azorensis]SHH34604.1 hypothetical protein SAMN02745135_00497 [Caloranaerobacter azorensis DSM 13643]